MTTTPPEAPSGPTAEGPSGAGPHEGPRATRDEVRDLGRLRRTVTDRKVAGVAGGLARHLDVDPVILRVAFVVLAFFGGAGLILYGACWLLVPEEGRPSAPLDLDDRSRSVALIIVGVIAALALLGDSWGGFWFPWPLAVIALVVAALRDPQGPRPRHGRQAGTPPHGRRDRRRPRGVRRAELPRRRTPHRRTPPTHARRRRTARPAYQPVRRRVRRRARPASAARSCSGSRSR